MSTNPSTRKPALGRGLGALIAPPPAAAPAAVARPQGLQQVPLDRIDPNPHQPRKQFDEQAIRELADSISVHGLLAPLTVRPRGERFELIAGERRFRALQLLDRGEALAFVRQVSDAQSMVLALTENIQRAELNAMEIAHGFALLAEEGLTHQEIAQRVGKSRAAVTNHLRLLQLPEMVRAALLAGKLDAGHARALLALDDAEQMQELARQIMAQQLSVRDAEQLASGRKAEKGKRPAKPRDANIRALEEKFGEQLATKVTVRGGKRGGTVVIRFRSLDDFERIFRKLL